MAQFDKSNDAKQKDTGNSYRIKTDNSRKPPIIFQPRSILQWILLVEIVFVSIYAAQSCSELYVYIIGSCSKSDLINNDSSSLELLRINAGILSTMLVVTLSMTLVALQLRSPAYVLNGLMHYLKNWFVYALLLLFMGGAAFSMIATFTLPFFPKPHIITPYVITITFFSMWYFVAYVYHMVYKVDPFEMLEEIRKNMFDAVNKIILPDTNSSIYPNSHSIDSSNGKEYFINADSFDKWKNMMRGAVDQDDERIFQRGMLHMIHIIKFKIFLRNDSIYFTNYAGSYLIDIMEYCIEHNRSRLEQKFMYLVGDESFHFNILGLSHNNPDLKNWTQTILYTLDQIMSRSINDDDVVTFKISLDAMMRTMNYPGSLEIIPKNIVDMMTECIEKNRKKLMKKFTEQIMGDYILTCNFNNPQIMHVFLPDMLDIWHRIILNAIDKNDEDTLISSVNVMIDGLIIFPQKYSSEFLSFIEEFVCVRLDDVIKFSITQRNDWLVKIFINRIIKPFFLMRNKPKTVPNLEKNIWRIWLKIIIATINTRDELLFQQYMLLLLRPSSLSYINNTNENFFLPFFKQIKNYCEFYNPDFLKLLKNLSKSTQFEKEFDFESEK